MKRYVVPGEVSAVNDDAPDCGAMAANPFGCRVHHDVGTVVDGVEEVAAHGKGVVDNKGHPVGLCHSSNGGKVWHAELWVWDCLDEDGLRVAINVGSKGSRVVGIDKARLDAETWQQHFELVVGAAVELSTGHNVVSCPCESHDCLELRRLSACGGHSTNTVLEGCHALLKHVCGGVHHAGVDVAKLTQPKQSCSVVRVAEGKRGCGVHWHCP